jgi:hypothetical protein
VRNIIAIITLFQSFTVVCALDPGATRFALAPAYHISRRWRCASRWVEQSCSPRWRCADRLPAFGDEQTNLGQSFAELNGERGTAKRRIHVHFYP